MEQVNILPIVNLPLNTLSKDVVSMQAPFPGGDPKEDEKDDEEAEVDGELGHQESRTVGGLHQISLEFLDAVKK